MSVRRLITCACLLVPLVGCDGEPAVFSPGPNDQRLVVAASALAVVSDANEANALPGTLTFGGAREPELLLLSFDPIWAHAGNVRAAFLHLTPRSGAPPSAARTVVHASRVGASWHHDGDFDETSHPSLGPPYAEATSDTDGSLSIDVTALVRSADKHPDDDYGIALTAERGPEPGNTYATGASGGVGPRLELFVR